jgi:hypothetical protein
VVRQPGLQQLPQARSGDDFILSYVYNRHTDTLVELCAYADASDPPPTPRAKSMLALLNSRIAPLIGTTLATNRQLGLHGLSPRLRQTLELLLVRPERKTNRPRSGPEPRDRPRVLSATSIGHFT